MRAAEAVISDARYLVDLAKDSILDPDHFLYDPIEDLRMSLQWYDREPDNERELIALIMEKQEDHTVSADTIMAVVQRALDDSPMLDTRIKVIDMKEAPE